MEFKVGDLVRVERANYSRFMIGGIFPITRIAYGNLIYLAGSGSKYWQADHPQGSGLSFVGRPGEDKEVKKSMARKKYILLKDTPELKKGAILEEMCDDGTQDFTVTEGIYSEESDRGKITFSRKVVMKQPNWFEEVTLWHLTKAEVKKLLSRATRTKTKKRGPGRSKKKK